MLNVWNRKNIRSVGFLKRYRGSKRLSIVGDNYVEDDDLNPILNLQNVEKLGLGKRKSYSPDVDLIKESLGMN